MLQELKMIYYHNRIMHLVIKYLKCEVVLDTWINYFSPSSIAYFLRREIK